MPGGPRLRDRIVGLVVLTLALCPTTSRAAFASTAWVTSFAGSGPGIGDRASFTAARPVPRQARAPATGGAGAAARPTGRAGPSFDCAKAAGPVEKLICTDPGLASRDRALAAAYARAMSQWSAQVKAMERTAQRTWLVHRNACAKERDVRACVEASYQRCLIEVQIRGGQLQAPSLVGYRCKGHEQTPLTVAFYNQTDPRSVIITFGNRQTIAFAVPSGSGARHANAEVELWEHQGDATVTWARVTYECKLR
jgi:uncharacterized protein